MASTISINGRPDSTQAVSWSFLADLAIGCGDSVWILTPTITANQSPDPGPQWEQAQLTISDFDDEERPLLDPGSFAHWSIGEEESIPQVASLAWSPVGIGKHQRPVLGVLTSNHLLSLWMCGSGRSALVSAWQRNIIINQLLNSHITGPNGSSSDGMEHVDRRTRIRAFAWAEELPARHGTAPVQLLAVANDNNEVFLCLVRPANPLATAGPTHNLAAMIITQLTVPGSPQNLERFTFEDYIGQETSVKSLCWSSWRRDEDGQVTAFLALTSHSSVLIYTCSFRDGAPIDTFDLELSEPNVTTFNSSPSVLRWSPDRAEDGSNLLVAVDRANVVHCALVQTAASPKWHEIDLKRSGFDRCSAIAFVHVDEGMEVHLSFESSSLLNEPVALSQSELKVLDQTRTVWQNQMIAAQSIHSKTKPAVASSSARVSGMDSSATHDLVAVCTSILPADQVEYASSAAQISYVLINSVISSDSRNLYGAGRVLDQSTESILLSAYYWLAKYGVDERSSAAKTIGAWLADATNALPSDSQLATSPSMEVSADEQHLVSALVDAVGPRNLSQLRCEEIFNLLNKAPRVTTPQAREVLHCIGGTLRGLAHQCYDSDIARQIIDNYASMMETTQDTQVDPRIRTTMSCILCGASIPFEGLESAQCSNGHRFDRCNLTLLPILEPGIFKNCGVCSRGYLNDKYLLGHDKPTSASNDAASRGSCSLVAVLLRAFRTCLYCGGRFVG